MPILVQTHERTDYVYGTVQRCSWYINIKQIKLLVYNV